LSRAARLDDSPMRKVRKPKEPRGRVRFLSDDERQRLLDACKASDSRYLYIVTVLALSTGARKMELLNLTWQDVDLIRNQESRHECDCVWRDEGCGNGTVQGCFAPGGWYPAVVTIRPWMGGGSDLALGTPLSRIYSA
jgi:hypothetical protein